MFLLFDAIMIHLPPPPPPPVKIFVKPIPGVLVLLRELASTTKRVHTNFYKFEYNFSPSISQLMSLHMKTSTDLNLYEVICIIIFLSSANFWTHFWIHFFVGVVYSHLRFHRFGGCTVRPLIKFFQATFLKKNR